MICSNCGAENRDDARFCANCGAPTSAAPTDSGTVILPPEATVHEPQAAYTPPPAAPAPVAVQPVAPAAPPKPKRKFRWGLACLVLVFLFLCLAVLAIAGIGYFKPEWLPFEIPFLSGSNNRILVGFPNRDGETALYLLRLGQKQEQGTLLADRVTQPAGNFWIQQDQELLPLTGISYPFGGFVPGQNYALYWYNDNGEISVDRIIANQKTPVNLFSGSTPSIWGQILTNPLDIFMAEFPDSNRARCYISRNGVEADRVTDGTQCSLTSDFSTSYAYDLEGDESTLTLVNLTDNSESTPLNNQTGVDAYVVSGDSSRVAYVDTTESPKVVLLNGKDGVKVVEGDPVYAVMDLGFARNANIAYYIDENEDGNVELYTLNDSGAALVATDLTIGASLTDDGQYLVYLAGPIDGEKTLFVRNVSSGANVEVVRGDNLTFTVASPIGRIFISDITGGDLTVYSANLDGSDLVTLYNESDMTLDIIQYTPGTPFVFLFVHDPEGMTTLFATAPNLENGFSVVDGWSAANLLDISSDGTQALLTGRENVDDDGALYLTSLDSSASLNTLDNDAVTIANAIFTSRGDQVIYTAVTGDRPNDVEVRRIRTSGNKPAEVLYADAFLVNVQWGSIDAFQYLYQQGGYVSTSYCPGATPIAVDETKDATLEAGVRDCYSFRGTADESYTFWVQGADELNTSLTLYDRQGNYIASDDYGLNGTDPRLIATLPTDGIYYIEVLGINEAAGVYKLSAAAGTNYCPGVPPLGAGDLLQGTTGTNGKAYFGFTGKANQTFTFWTQDTAVDTYLTLYDRQGVMVNADQSSLGGYVANLPADGNYCLEISTYGMGNEPFSVGMAEGAMFCPGANTIALDQTVNGNIDNGNQACYSFSPNTNTTYTFLVDSPDGADTTLELYDSQGNLINSDDDSGGNLNPRLTFSVSETGTYYVLIHGFSTDSYGNYNLTLTEGSGICRNSQPITLGDTVNGTIQSYVENCYSFTTTSAQAYTFWVESSIDTVLVLYDQDGNEIGFDDDSGGNFNPRLQISLPNAGTYYIAVHGYGSNSGDYTLHMDTSSAASVCNESAPPIAIGDVINGSVAAYTQNCYVFTASANQTLLFWVDAPIDTLLILYDQNGMEIDRDDDSGGNYNPRLLTTLSNAGTYYISIQGYGSNSGNYTLHMETAQPPEDAFTTAILLLPNTRTRDAITENDYIYLPTYDYTTHGVVYYFDGTAGQTIQIDVFADSLGSSIDPTAYLFDSAYNSLTSDDDGGTGYDSLITFTLPSTGRYYIMVQDLSGDFGDASSYFFEILLTVR